MSQHFLILGEDESSVTTAVDRFFPFQSGQKFYFYSESDRVCALAKAKGFIVLAETEILPAARLKQANAQTYELANVWHSQTLIDQIIRYEEIPIASLIEKDFTYCLIRLVRRLLVIKELIKKKNIGCIYYFEQPQIKPHTIRWQAEESILPAIAKLLQSYTGIPVKILGFRSQPAYRPNLHLWFQKILRPVTSFLYNKWIRTGNQKNGVLFSGNPAFLFPVAREVSKSAGPVYFEEWLGPNLIKRLREKKITGISLWDGFSFFDFLEKQRLKERWQELIDLQGLEKQLAPIFQIEGVPLFPALKDRINFFIQELFPDLYIYLKRLDRILSQTSFQSLLVDEDVSEKKRALVLMANRKKIKTVVMMHGVPARRIGYAPLSANYMAVWGDAYMTCLEQWGIASDRLVITGNPRYEGLLPHQNYSLRPDLQQLVTTTKPVLLALNMYRESWKQCFFGESFTYLEMQENIEKVCRVLSHFPELSLVIKLHPRDQHPESYERMVKVAKKEAPNLKIALTQQDNIFALLQSCFCVFTSGSSVSVDALWYHKPVFLLDFFGHDDIYDYFDLRWIPRARNENELKQFLAALLKGNWQLPLQSENPFFSNHKTPAVKRLADFLISGEMGVLAEKTQPSLQSIS